MKDSLEIDDIALPTGWVIVQLSDVAEIIRGVTYAKGDVKEEPNPGYVPVLRATNIQNGSLVLDKDLVYVPVSNIGSHQVLRLGDIVVATSSGSKHLVGKTAQVKSAWNGSFGAFCAAIRPDERVFSSFIGYFLESPSYKSFIATRAIGVNINNLRRGDLEEIQVPLAPINEQIRIVAEIEKQISRLDEALSTLRRARVNLKRYKTSVVKAGIEGRLTEYWRDQHPDVEPADILLARVLSERRKAIGKGKHKELVGPDTSELSELPAGWAWTNFEVAAERVTVGHVGSMKDEYVDRGIPFLRSQNVRENRYDPEGLKYISEAFHKELRKSSLKPGDIVVVRSGSVGVSCVIPENLLEANCSDLVIIKSPRAVLPAFGAYYINSVVESRVAAGKVGVALAHFNTQSVAELPVPIPPISEQSQIVFEVERRLSIAAGVETQIEANLHRIDRIRQSIIKQAFSGQLVPQDPKDEPASVLLDSISEIQGETKFKDKTKVRKSGRLSKVKTEKSTKPLLDIIKKHPDGITPEALLAEANYSLDNIDTFYEQLALIKDLIEQEKPIGSKAYRWPKTPLVILKPKEA